MYLLSASIIPFIKVSVASFPVLRFNSIWFSNAFLNVSVDDHLSFEGGVGQRFVGLLNECNLIAGADGECDGRSDKDSEISVGFHLIKLCCLLLPAKVILNFEKLHL